MVINKTDKPINIGIAIINNIDNENNDNPYKELKKTALNYQKKYAETSIGKIPDITYARQLFKSIKLDPTKYRPSSEALLKRAIKNKPLPKINPAVDLGNWCSLDFLLPICVYDADKILGKIILRLGLPNESYLAINNRQINLTNRFVLADKKGAFGSPITDSIRSMVSNNTKNLILIIYFHRDIPDNKKEEMLEIFIKRTLKYLGGNLSYKKII